LVRGIEKDGRGRVKVRSHVSEICIVDGKAVGVRLRKDADNGKMLRAKKGVISNLSIWDLLNSGIVDVDAFPSSFVEERRNIPACPSFMHLHVGFRMTREELSALQAHYIYVDDWERSVTDEENCALLSIPSVHDATLAPEGYAVLHVYTPATERYDRWEGMKRNTPEYDELKEERSAFLWKVLEKVIPDIRTRAVHRQVGTPLTHQRYLNRHRGTYGPAIYAGDGSFPFPNTPVKNLLLCGDSCFPGIGVPAVSGSGVIAANTISLDTIGGQLDVLRKMKAQS
jgi:phytoene dehydrogenase-like protein